MTPDEAEFEAEFPPSARTDEPALVVDVEGFEGPLDLLLMLARQQKVDLAKISILALADQYLAFIEEARRLRLELAADYLVMAAWLAYLKSRLLLPETNAPEGMSAEDMANALAHAAQAARSHPRRGASRLFERPQLDRDVFARGAARADRPYQASGMDGDALRSALGLCAAAPEDTRSRMCACQARGVVAGRGARGARAPDRRRQRTGRGSTNT